MIKIEWVCNVVGYIVKYVSKGDFFYKLLKGVCMYGNGGFIGDVLLEQWWWKLFVWLWESVEFLDCVRRCFMGIGGGFFYFDIGEVYESFWEVFFKGGLVYIVWKGESV